PDISAALGQASRATIANRRRRQVRQAAEATAPGVFAGPAEDEPASRRPRPSWARLLHKICEIDPLLCPKCRVRSRL
ncbi:MAG: hypothetical protein KAY32_17730, partial [Candidatus Eisenbacteria sp.]|nr:hypothetical protein [Candidatus Eisenbacteria bacterium]